MPIRIYSYILVLSLFCMASISFAAEGEFKSLEQKFSYTIGYTFSKQLKDQAVGVDKAALMVAIDDVFASKAPRLTREEMAQAMSEVKAKIIQTKQDEARRGVEEGQKFLAENKKKDGVVILPTGTQYIELVAGKGDSPKKDSDVTVNYVGTHISGAVFDSSKRHGGPATFNLARVIPGFRDAISKMKNGAKWQVFVPSDQAYGEAGSPPAIKPNETLIFEIELVSFKDAAPAAEAAK